jgi:quercetin dioxygenase-like cupin family protein
MIFDRLSRRCVLVSSAGFAASTLAAQATEQVAQANGYSLAPEAGEHLIQRGGNIFINVAPTTGSKDSAMGTQQVLTGIGIPIHRHFEMDEAFYVLEGGGTFTLGDSQHPIEKGSSIFIPRNNWHGFQNPGRELALLWMATPAGLEAFFREVATRPGVPPVQRTKDQLNAIARRYGTEFR